MGDLMVKLLEEMELTRLPSLPHVLIKLLNACHEDNVCFDTLTEIISNDASLSAKLISVANSAVYGRAGKFTTYKQILLYLGLDSIKSIAITASVQQFFSHYSKEKSRFLKNFWKHTLNTAIVAKSLAKITSYENYEEAYLAGLLHDVGQLVFEDYSKNDYSGLVYSTITSEGLLNSEREKYDITHDAIGAQLLELWGVPEVICEAVKYHHANTSDIHEAHHLVKIINLASKLTASDQSNSGELLDYEYRAFDLSDAVLTDILDKAQEEVNKVAASLGIDIGDSEAADENNEKKQIQLAKAIRNITLTKGSVQPVKVDTAGIGFAAIQKGTMILFGLDKSCLFLYDADKSTLFLEEKNELIKKNILEGVEISRESTSLLAASINSGEIKSSFANDKASNLPVVDKQIISAFNTEGVLCVPLSQAGKCLGVIVVGVSDSQYHKLIKKISLLKMYATEISGCVSSARNRQKLEQDFVSNSQEQIHSKAREIIHEVNNPLAVIRNYLHILGNRFTDNNQVQHDLRIIREEIDRVGGIILKCDKGFSEIGNLDQLYKVDVNEVITSVNDIMKSSLYVSHKVKSKLDLDSGVGLVYANKNSLKQILMNLVKNSVEAMADNKELSIATRDININGKMFVEIEVVDTGPGISEEILKKLYKPVKSTKGKLHSGLGLSIVKNLLDEMGGAITCKSTESGTAFSIHFPLEKKGSHDE